MTARDSIIFDFSIFTKALERTLPEVKASALVGVHDATDDLLARSREEAPLDKGTLRMTAGKDVEADGDIVTGEVYFSATEQSAGGERYNYALRVHEMDEYKNPTTPGTRPKYLERPLKANAQRYIGIISDAVRKGLR